jgi:hypothetical protein
MSEHTLKAEDLRHFAGGTSTWWRHPLNSRVTYTDGVKHVAEAGGAFWLIDEIALIQPYEPKVNREEFQAWKLKVDEASSSGELTCEDGGKNGCEPKVVYRKSIPFTDFPLPEITLWFTGGVILLPCEY